MDIRELLRAGRIYMHRRIDEVFVKDAETHETLAVYREAGSRHIMYEKVETTIVVETPIQKDPHINNIVETGKGSTPILFSDQAPPLVQAPPPVTKTVVTWVDPTTSNSGKSIRDLVETNKVAFSEYAVHQILEDVSSGSSLTKVCSGVPPMPSYMQFIRWMKIHPWIKPLLEDARLARAEYFRDKVHDEAYTAKSTRDPVDAAKVRIDASKWLASIDDPKYKQNNKVDVAVNIPQQIIVTTGISRDVTDTPQAPHQETPPQKEYLESSDLEQINNLVVDYEAAKNG